MNVFRFLRRKQQNTKVDAVPLIKDKHSHENLGKVAIDTEDNKSVEDYEIIEMEILPEKMICPDCGGITLVGLEFCDKCGGELIIQEQ